MPASGNISDWRIFFLDFRMVALIHPKTHRKLHMGIKLWHFAVFLSHVFHHNNHHRYRRDKNLGAKKYGEAWKKYCEIVPYLFIPFIF